MPATADPDILIEERQHGYVRYRHRDGRHWAVHGICDHNRACMVGAVVDGVLVETVEQARALPTPALDCPVGPGFKGCCDLRIEELCGRAWDPELDDLSCADLDRLGENAEGAVIVDEMSYAFDAENPVLVLDAHSPVREIGRIHAVQSTPLRIEEL